MREISFLAAIIEAIGEEMARDDRVIMIGQHMANSPFNTTNALFKKFGPKRMIDTPISETGEVGMAVGAAMTGFRPIVEIPHIDFLPVCMDQIVNQAAKIEFMLGDQFKVPIVIHTEGGAGGSPVGGSGSAGPHHSQSLEALFTHIPGLVVVRPSNPRDAKGLMKSAIRSDKPVIFIGNKYLYSIKGSVPDGEYVVPLGEALVRREGSDLTLVAISQMVDRALIAAQELSKMGVEIEIIDPRTLAPVDRKTIITSVQKTGRLMFVHEACERGGIGSEMTGLILKEVFSYLDSPIEILGAKNIPVPVSPVLEKATIPQVEDIIETVRGMVL